MDITALKKRADEQSKQTFKVKDYTFTYKMVGGTQLMKIGADNAGKTSQAYIDVFIQSIVDWSNVKVKDIIDIVSASDIAESENEVPFDKELFDIFLSRHIDLSQDIFSAIATIQANNVKETETKKKK